MKTSELIGAQLDWAVAKCEGENVMSIAEWRNNSTWWKNLPRDLQRMHEGVDKFVVDTGSEVAYAVLPAYSTNWAQGGPIIEREKISTNIGHSGVWLACCMYNYDDVPRFMQSGSTALIAAMRCYVASKLGNEIEIPEELK